MIQRLTSLFFFALLIFVKQKGNAQPKEFYGEGQYWEHGAINYLQYPYTLFNRVNGETIETQLSNIREAILQGQPLPPSTNRRNEVAKLYFDLYSFATAAMPSKIRYDEPAKRPAWAKACAFIGVLGLNAINS